MPILQDLAQKLISTATIPQAGTINAANLNKGSSEFSQSFNKELAPYKAQVTSDKITHEYTVDPFRINLASKMPDFNIYSKNLNEKMDAYKEALKNKPDWKLKYQELFNKYTQGGTEKILKKNINITGLKDAQNNAEKDKVYIVKNKDNSYAIVYNGKTIVTFNPTLESINNVLNNPSIDANVKKQFEEKILDKKSIKGLSKEEAMKKAKEEIKRLQKESSLSKLRKEVAIARNEFNNNVPGRSELLKLAQMGFIPRPNVIGGGYGSKKDKDDFFEKTQTYFTKDTLKNFDKNGDFVVQSINAWYGTLNEKALSTKLHWIFANKMKTVGVKSPEEVNLLLDGAKRRLNAEIVKINNEPDALTKKLLGTALRYTLLDDKSFANGIISNAIKEEIASPMRSYIQTYKESPFKDNLGYINWANDLNKLGEIFYKSIKGNNEYKEVFKNLNKSLKVYKNKLKNTGAINLKYATNSDGASTNVKKFIKNTRTSLSIEPSNIENLNKNFVDGMQKYGGITQLLANTNDLDLKHKYAYIYAFSTIANRLPTKSDFGDKLDKTKANTANTNNNIQKNPDMKGL